ncbi:DapH/DapD/GlmU-related protein [Vibrio cholerae]
MIFIVKLFNKLFLYYTNMRRFFLKRLFLEIGSNVVFSPSDTFTFGTIKIGNDCYIGPGARFIASNSSITISDKVLFGPNVTIMGGDHNISVVGEFMFDVSTKLPENDSPVIIESDVWVGCNVTILKGVTIGRGAVVAAGSVVTKSVERYSIVGGVPAKKIKSRFNIDEIRLHEKALFRE